MEQQSSPVEAYEANAELFAALASSRDKNSHEYEVNLPSIQKLSADMDGEVLDFGCGAGNFTQFFASKRRIMHACDASPALVGIASRSNPNTDVFVWDAMTGLPRKEKFRLVIAKLTLHYVRDLDTVLGNIADGMEQNGKLVISVPHPDKTAMKVGNSLAEEIYVDEIGSFGLSFEMVHRSLQRYLDAAKSVGFVLDEMDEPRRIGELPKRLNMALRKSV